MSNLLETLPKLDEYFCKAFTSVCEDHSQRKVLNEQDFRATFYFHLRPLLESLETSLEGTKYNISLDSSLDVSLGSWGKATVRPDILVIGVSEEIEKKPLIVGEFKFGRTGKDALDEDFKRLGMMKRQYGLPRGYFLGITDKDVFHYMNSVINSRLYQKEHVMELMKSRDWASNYLRVLAYSYTQSVNWEATFEETPTIRKL